MEQLDRITLNPAVMGGKPCIRGMRVTVGMIIGQLGAGETMEKLLADYPYLEQEDILQALQYAAWLAGGMKSFWTAQLPRKRVLVIAFSSKNSLTVPQNGIHAYAHPHLPFFALVFSWPPPYTQTMTIEQTVDITGDHYLHLALPLELPVGRARVELTITPEPALAKAADELEKIVAMMAAEYAADSELTTFCALDGEDFYETR